MTARGGFGLPALRSVKPACCLANRSREPEEGHSRQRDRKSKRQVEQPPKDALNASPLYLWKTPAEVLDRPPNWPRLPHAEPKPMQGLPPQDYQRGQEDRTGSHCGGDQQFVAEPVEPLHHPSPEVIMPRPWSGWTTLSHSPRLPRDMKAAGSSIQSRPWCTKSQRRVSETLDSPN